MIEFREIVEEVEEIISQADNNKFEEWSSLEEKESMNDEGIYIVKKKFGEIFYIGSATKQSLKERLLNEHLKGKNTALNRKIPKYAGMEINNFNKKEYTILPKEYKNNVANFLKENCLFLVKSVKDFDKVLAIEYLLIYYYRQLLKEKGLKLLNDYKD